MARKKLNIKLGDGYCSIPVVAQDGSIWVDHSDGLYRIENNEATCVLPSKPGLYHTSSQFINEQVLRNPYAPPAVLKNHIMVSRVENNLTDEIQHSFHIYVYTDKGELLRKVPLFKRALWLLATDNAVFVMGEYKIWILNADGDVKHEIQFTDEFCGLTDHSTCIPARNGIVFTRAEAVFTPGKERIVNELPDGRLFVDAFSLYHALYRLSEDGALEKIWVSEKNCINMLEPFLLANGKEIRFGDMEVETRPVTNYDSQASSDDEEQKEITGNGIKLWVFGEDDQGKMQLNRTVKYGEWDNPVGPSVNGKIGVSMFWGLSQYENTILGTDYFCVQSSWIPGCSDYDPNKRGSFVRLWLIPKEQDDNPTTVTVPEPFLRPSAVDPLMLSDGRILITGTSSQKGNLVATYRNGEWTMEKTPIIEYWFVHEDKVIAFSHERHTKIWEI